MSNKVEGDLKIILYILLFNALLALLYLIWSILKKDYRKGGMMTLFILVAPVIGPLYLGVSAVLYELIFKHRTKILSLEDLSFRKDKVEWIAKDDMESALNKVPIEEALLVSGVHSTRRLILDVLKEDTGSYVHSISQATDNRDSEVSHYAATAITDIMNRFKHEEKKLRKTYEEDPTDEVAAEMYWYHIINFLETGVLPRVEQERYFKILEDLTFNLQEEMEAVVTGEKYYRLTLMGMRTGKMDRAQLWVEEALAKRADDLHSYKAGLEYYYESNQIEQYKVLLNKLKESTIRLDEETLELVRFYNQ